MMTERKGAGRGGVRFAAFLALAGPLFGCRSGRAPAENKAPLEAAPSAPAPAPAPPRDDMNLLGLAGVDLRVSSEVVGASDFPAHLTDGNLGTSWQGRSGDLAGAWIEIDLPAAVRVRRISLTPGYAKKSGARDLFRENYRIAEVAIFRDGVPVKAVSFDVERPELQGVELDEPGGTFRVEVKRVVAGTVKRYREVCVSELTITGDAGGVPEASGKPTVRVGPRETVSQLRHAGEAVGTFEELCGGARRPNCKPGGIDELALDPAHPVLEIVPFTVDAGWIETRLAVRTAKGWFELPIDFDRGPPCEGTALSTRVVEAKMAGGFLLLRVRSGTNEQGVHVEASEPMRSIVETAYVCGFGGRELYCGDFVTARAADSTAEDALLTAKWRREKVVRLDPSGRLSVGISL